MAETTEEFKEHILDVNVTGGMESSSLEHTYSVIYTRALPDARDGLKPAQRRILSSMDDMSVKPRRGYVKRTHVVGQMMGVLYPHDDSIIYDALVYMAQPQVMRLPLVDGHGNFKSLDVGPAAVRYAECQMVHLAVVMTAGLDEDAVDLGPNYNGKDTEPEALPAALPNLLVNGTSEIAVGMTTDIAPHNLRRVVSALKALLGGREVSPEELIRHLPRPDFPGGGRIAGLESIRDAHTTGRGSFKARARASVERVSAHRRGIVITELSYLVGLERVIEQIKKGIDSHKLAGIAGVKDLTDLANDTRLVVEVKNSTSPEAPPKQLYRAMKLEDTFAINAVVLVEGQPRTLALKQLLEVYLDHRLQVTIHCARHRLGKAREWLHLVGELLLAIVDIDEVTAIIHSGEGVTEAYTQLMDTFGLDETQASHILDMQLRRLTKYSTLESNAEADELAARIDELQRILNDDTVLNASVSSELDEMAERFGTPRRTALLAADGVVRSAAPLEAPGEPCWTLLSTTEHVARTGSAAPLPVTGPRAVRNVTVAMIGTTSHAESGVITNTGRLLRARAAEFPTVPLTAMASGLWDGSESQELWPPKQGERVVGLASLSSGGPGLVLEVLRGVAKRVNPEVIGKDSWDVIRLEKGDEVVGAVELESPNLTFITSDTQLLRLPANLVRPQGRLGGGVTGVKLSRGAKMLFFGGVDPTTDLVVTIVGAPDSSLGHTTAGAKVTPLAEYPTKGRATGGVRCQCFLKGETALITAAIGGFMTAVVSGGAPVALPEPMPKRDGSGVSLKGVVEALGARRTPEVVELTL